MGVVSFHKSSYMTEFSHGHTTTKFEDLQHDKTCEGTCESWAKEAGCTHHNEIPMLEQIIFIKIVVV